MKKIIKEITPIKKKIENASSKKRVAAYARVSTEQDEQLHSLQVQRDYYENYIKSNPDEWELVQAKLELNNQVKSHSNNVLFGRVICADCGSIYGPKVCHSNDIYGYVV